MRYRLRTLLLMLAVGPALLIVAWIIGESAYIAWTNNRPRVYDTPPNYGLLNRLKNAD